MINTIKLYTSNNLRVNKSKVIFAIVSLTEGI